MSFDSLSKWLERVKEGQGPQAKKRVDGYLIIPLDKRKVKEDYIMVFQERLVELAGMDLTLYEWKVLAFLLGITDFENWILITQQEIADRTGIHRPDVTKTIKSLVDKGLITVERRGRQNAYRLNPLVAWKGRETNRQNVLKLDE